MSIIPNNLPPKYDEANHVINKHIVSILGSIIVFLIPIILYAGSAWVDKQIEDGMGQYATKTDIVNIQTQLTSNSDSFATKVEIVDIKKQISTNQIDSFQEQVYTIEDKKIDGLAKPSDEKKLLRLNTKIKRIKERMKLF